MVLILHNAHPASGLAVQCMNSILGEHNGGKLIPVLVAKGSTYNRFELEEESVQLNAA